MYVNIIRTLLVCNARLDVLLFIDFFFINHSYVTLELDRQMHNNIRFCASAPKKHKLQLKICTSRREFICIISYDYCVKLKQMETHGFAK